MQQFPELNDRDNAELVAAFSRSRMSRYLADARGDTRAAIKLYNWNMRLSQALYVPLQIWEITFRNRLNNYLSLRYSDNWPYDSVRAARQLTSADRASLERALERQGRKRRTAPVSTGAVVADLSAGFWVSQISGRYEVPYRWRRAMSEIFPHDLTLAREEAHGLSVGVLALRNRIAHHEPIYHMRLASLNADIGRLVDAMNPAAFSFLNQSNTFEPVFRSGPR